MSFTKQSLQTFIFQVAGFVIVAITGMITARALGPTDKGLSAVVLLYPTLFFTLGHLTIGLSVIHHIGKKEHTIEEYAGNSLLITAIISVLISFVFLGSIFLFKKSFYKDIPITYLAIAMVSIPFYLITYYFSSILQGTLNIKWYNIANQIPKGLTLLLVITLVLLGRFTALEAIIVVVIGVGVGGIICLWKVREIFPKKWAINKKLLGKLLRDGGKIHIGTIATFIFSHVHIFIINYYLSKDDVGYYCIAYALAGVLLFISISVETVLYPKVSGENLEEASGLVTLACRQTFLITLICALILGVLGRYFVLLYGGKAYLPAVAPLLFFLPGMVIFVIPKILATLWVRKGWFLQLTFIAIITATVSILLSVFLVPKYGIKGAALANSLTYLFAALISMVLYYGFVNHKFWRLFWFKKTDWQIYSNAYKKLMLLLKAR